MNRTTNLNLKKPEESDFVNIEDLNFNFEKLDEEAGTARTVPRGGTGKSSVTPGNYLVGNGTNALQEKTPAQVLEDIGGSSEEHTHAQSDITGLASALGNKENKASFVNYTIASSGWSNSQYSFESTYPFASYNLEICGLQDTATEVQKYAFEDADIRGSISSNIIKAVGTVPTVNIPVILKVVSK